MRTLFAILLGLGLTLSGLDALAQKPSKKVSSSKSKSKSKRKKSSKKKSKRRKNAPGLKEFKRGVRFFRAKEFEAALPLFRKAYELSGHRRSTVLALAQCERALKMYDDAIAHYREYLAMNPPNAEKIRETVKLTQELLDAQKEAEGEVEDEPAVAEATPSVPSAAPSAEAQTKDALIAKPVPPPGSSAQGSDTGSSLNVWLWTIGSIVVVGGGAAAGYFLWPQSEAYGGSAGIVARPMGD
ncbi:MAG: tetratricopeptide repeat protein [Myxococcota bacterium]|nr:tetratricopeptide repeat protein [Myxococcota bacterium]